MKNIFVASIIIASVLIGCGHGGFFNSNSGSNIVNSSNNEIAPVIHPLQNTPVSVFDLALVRAELELNRMVYTETHNPYISAVVTYRSNKGIIDIVITPWEFTTNQKLAENDPMSYSHVESEEEARAKLEDIFTFTSITIGEEESAYSEFLYDIGGEYFEKNGKKICKELGRITEISVRTYYDEHGKTYYLSLSGSLDGEKEYKKKSHNSQ